MCWSRPTPRGVGGLKYPADGRDLRAGGSHPSRGGWIEISSRRVIAWATSSHPSRGGWIEILVATTATAADASHPSRGGWIEIWDELVESERSGPTPRGVGGLKFLGQSQDRSHSSWRVCMKKPRAFPRRLPKWEWIETRCPPCRLQAGRPVFLWIYEHLLATARALGSHRAVLALALGAV